MRRYFLIFITLFSLTAFANERCDRIGLTSKKKEAACYKQSAKDTKEALEEYHDAIIESVNIPPEVKENVLKKYDAYMQAINESCKTDECKDKEMNEVIKVIYQMTSDYTIEK